MLIGIIHWWPTPRLPVGVGRVLLVRVHIACLQKWRLYHHTFHMASLSLLLLPRNPNHTTSTLQYICCFTPTLSRFSLFFTFLKPCAPKYAMAPAVIKHILLAKFKDSITPEQEKDLINAYAALPNSISAMKGFEWYVLHLLFCFFPNLFNPSRGLGSTICLRLGFCGCWS